MEQEIKSVSPHAISFAIMNTMSNELSPLIQLLKEFIAAKSSLRHPLIEKLAEGFTNQPPNRPGT